MATISRLLLGLNLLHGVFSSPLKSRATVVDQDGLLPSYDYVVVGGGTSGLTVADRLSEIANVTILVIEYGYLDDQDPGTLVPGIAMPAKYWRNYTSTPQPGLGNRSAPLYTAQVVGGGTVINGMVFGRGSVEDYDVWEQLGNPGWGWDDLLPYFKKSENYTPATEELQSQYPLSPDLEPHGTQGPVQASYPVFQYSIAKVFYEAWQSIGIALNPQMNAGNPNGAIYSAVSLTFWNQSRCSARTAHFGTGTTPKSNYHLVTGQSVTQILIEGNNPIATGVMSLNRTDNSTWSVQANQEVILAAGSVRSPGILQRSGIGPAALLAELGIEVIQDLPGVGYNFHDQPTFYAAVNFSDWKDPTVTWLSSNQTYATEQLNLYYGEREGAYTITYESGSLICYLSLPNITDQYQTIIESASSVDSASTLPAGADATVQSGYEAQLKLLLQQYASTNSPVEEIGFSGSSGIPIVHIKPLSRGSIQINSTQPLADPVVDFGTFRHPTDIEVFIELFRKTREWYISTPFIEIGAQELNPGANITTDAGIAQILREQVTSSWQHPVGTLSMIPRELGGVVDPELNVYGVGQLRVVDASIIPMIPAGHIQATVYAVAEKAAELIKASRRVWHNMER